MALAPDQVQLSWSSKSLLMGPGTVYTVLPGWDPWSRTNRRPQSKDRPHAHGSLVGSEWVDEATVLIPVSVYRDGASKAEWMAARQELSAAFVAVGDSGEVCELSFEWGGREYVLFGRPAQVRSSADNVSVGKSVEQCVFIAADPRIYSADLSSSSTGLPIQQGGLTVPADVPSTRLRLPGASGAYASTPDTASLDITGDVDLRADVALEAWSGVQQTLIAKYATGTNQRSYALVVLSTGMLRMLWSETGAAGLTADSTVAPTVASGGRLAVGATLDVDNGAAGRTITFYTAPTMAGPWTVLGSPVPQAGVTSLFVGSAELSVGAWNTGGVDNPATGWFYAGEVRSGIGGTVAANPDFTVHSPGLTGFTDSTGKAWSVNGTAAIEGHGFRAGLTVPFTVPGVLVGGEVQLVNTGTADAGLTVRIDGPAVEPKLILRRPDGTVQSVKFDLTLADGQWLDIDSTSRLALLNSLPDSNQRGRATWDMDPYPIPPGTSTLRFGSAVFNATASLTAEHRSAWW